MLARQLDLLGRHEPRFDDTFRRAGRRHLAARRESWVEHVPGWLDGHDVLFDRLEAAMTWRGHRRVMYDREVDVPRLFATPPDDGPGDPLLDHLSRALSRRYGRRLRHIHLALYRSGHDSVAWHGDRVGRSHPNTVVAILSLGGVRRFMMRPAGGGPSLSFAVGRGDLLVMGGACQSTWEHCVPKVAQAEPRMAVMFREALE